MRKPSLILSVLVAVAVGCGGDSSTVTIKPGAGAAAEVQAALINAKPGTVIQFEAGTYLFSEELSLTKSGVTIRGQSDRTKVILDFSTQAVGSPNGFQADGANDVVLENLTFQDSPGDLVRVARGKNVTFRNLLVQWTHGSGAENGGYGVYPVLEENILVEDCEVKGASDAGIYVGQSKTAVVRRNKVSGNHTGIEIENTDDAEVVDNLATDNVAGILVFNLPYLPRKEGSRTRVHRNMVMANNRAEFAVPGSNVTYVPPGTGMILMANDRAEIFGNTFTGNDSTALVVISCQTLELVSDGAVNCSDPLYDPYPEGLYIHDNTFTGNGTAPKGFYPVYWVDRDQPLYDIIWDGVVDTGKPNTDGSLSLCIKGNGTVTYAQINPAVPGKIDSTDLALRDCTHPALPEVKATW